MCLAVLGCGGAAPSAAGSASAAQGSAPVPARSATASATVTPSATATASGAASAASSSSAAPEPPPYAGKLTIEMVMGARGVARPFDPWEEAIARLDKRVGKPTFSKAEHFCWAVVEGTDCAYFCIGKTTGKKLNRPEIAAAVGTTDDPQKISSTGSDGEKKYCAERAAHK